MPANSPERDASTSPRRNGSPPLSDSSSPTRYSIDLSVLTRPPNNRSKTYSPTRAPSTWRNRMRKPPRAMSSSSLPLPSSPPRDKVTSDDIDGPEDFTINMSYWMRCDLSKALDGAKEVSKEQEEDPTLDESVVGWIARGNNRLMALQKQRLSKVAVAKVTTRHETTNRKSKDVEANANEPTRPENDEDTPRGSVVEQLEAKAEEIGERKQDDDIHSLSSATIEQQDEALSHLSNVDNIKTPRPIAPSALNVSSILGSSDALAGSPRSIREPPPVPRHATVEEYFSTPAKQPDPFVPLIERAAAEYRAAQHQAVHIPQSPATIRNEYAESQIQSLEAQVASLAEQLRQSRLETREITASSPKAYAAHLRAPEAEARAELETANRRVQDLTTQMMKREREWSNKLREADIEHVAEQQRLRGKLDNQLTELQTCLDQTEEQLERASAGSRSPQLEVEQRRIPRAEYEKQLQRLRHSYDEQVAVSIAQAQQQRPLTASSRPTVSQRRGLSPLSTGNIKSHSLEDIRTSPVAAPQQVESWSGMATPSPEPVLPTASNDPLVNRKLAQLLGVQQLPPASHLDRLVTAKEHRMRDIETRLDDAGRDRVDFQEQYEKERTQWRVDVAKIKGELRLAKTENEAKIEFLRAELEEKEEELVTERLRLVSAKRGAESAKERLRVVQEEHSEEVASLKSKVAEAEGWKSEMSRQVDEQRANIARLDGAVKALREEKRRWDDDAMEAKEQSDAVLDDVRKRAEEAVKKAGRMLEREKSARASAERELYEVREDMHSVQEQLRVSSLDGANERRDSGSEATSSGVSRVKEAELEAEIKTLRTAVEERVQEAKVARAAADAAEADLGQLKEQMAAINEAMDTKIAKMMKKREQEWVARFDALVKERSKIGRALMRSWGEHEVGEGKPQPYRYRYV